MNFLNSKQPEPSSPQSKTPPQLILQEAFNKLQNHCSGFLNNRNPASLKTHLESTLSNLQSNAKQAIEAGFSSFGLGSASGLCSSCKTLPVWARIAERNGSRGGAMSTEAMEERMAGVPVYALSNCSQEFVLISGLNRGKSLGLVCFKEEDAETLLEQMKSMDPGMRQGSKVVAVALNKVFQLKVDGVGFRLIPESSQIKNALKVTKQEGKKKKTSQQMLKERYEAGDPQRE